MGSLDNIFITVAVFSMAIIIVVGIVFWNAVNIDAIFDQNDYTKTVRSNASAFYGSLDNVFVIFFFVLHLGILILAFLLRSHPIIYIASIIIIAFLAIIAAPLSNAYEEFIADSTISVAASTTPYTNFLMSKLPMIEVIFGFITVIVLAGLAKGEGIIG